MTTTNYRATVRHQLQYGLGASYDHLTTSVGAATVRLALDQCDISEKPTLIYPDGEMIGALAHRSEPTAAGLKPINGTAAWRPRPDELTTVLPLIFGGTFAGSVLEPAHITSSFGFVFDRYVKVFTYAGCKVARATFNSSAGQSLRLSTQIEALTQTIGNAGTFPSLSLSLQQPLQHHQSVLTFGGTVRNVNNIQINVDNGLMTDRFYGSQTRIELPQTDRMITVSFDNPFTMDEYDMYQLATAGAAATLVYTNGNMSLTFEFPKLQAAPVAPAAPAARQEMGLRMELQARSVNGSGITAQEVKITLDATP